MSIRNLTDEEIAKLLEAFDSCDLNRDGQIDWAEFRSLLKKIDGDASGGKGELDLDFAYCGSNR
jgi:Ca2+-binding EF-hand superfamily protein